MAARYGIGSLANSNEFPRLQRKLENLYDSYNYNSNSTNVIKCSQIIEDNANLQRKLINSLDDIATEGPLYSTTRSLLRSSYYPYYYYRDYPYYYYYYPYYYPYTSAAAASAAADLAVYKTLSRKNAEIADISYKYEKDLNNLESELTHAKLDNHDLKSELDEAKENLYKERKRSDSISLACQLDLCELKAKLASAETKLSTLEPRAEMARELEREILDLKEEIRHVRSTNSLLADTNEIQAKIIKSRSQSPVSFEITHSRSRSRSRSRVCSRSASPVSESPCIRTTSPLSPYHSTQVIRQECLINRFNDLYSRDRLNAMDILRTYNDNYENNQRILFSAVQEAFSVAKRAFCDWKIRARSRVAITHVGPETLEEALQDYVNRNVDLYDLPYLTSEVLLALNRNPKISLPCGVSYSVVNTFIREACRIAWEMSALAYPLDTAFALDGEVFDDFKYRRTLDSEYSAPLVNHHVWPCLQQSSRVLVKGEACTRRGASIRSGSPLRSCIRNRSTSPVRRARSCYFS